MELFWTAFSLQQGCMNFPKGKSISISVEFEFGDTGNIKKN